MFINKKNKALNTICPYFTMFPLDFPLGVLKNAPRSSIVFDPFCGRGTTNYAARCLGMRSYGVDSNPIAHAVASAKFIAINPTYIAKRCKKILEEELCGGTPEIPKELFWKKAYHAKTLVEICALREYFLKKKKMCKSEVALRALMLGILHGPKQKKIKSYLSNQMPRTFSTSPNYSLNYWEKNRLEPEYVSLQKLVERKSLRLWKETIKESEGEVYLADTRFFKLPFKGSIDYIITSPPYFGMHTYTKDQWLRNWFLGSTTISSNKKQIRHSSYNRFINDLALVWRNSAKKSKKNTKLIIRFGGLPYKSEYKPRDTLLKSLQLANCGWSVQEVRPVPNPKNNSLQSHQFGSARRKCVEEIDVFATLNNSVKCLSRKKS